MTASPTQRNASQRSWHHHFILEAVHEGQGDREGRPYNTRWRIKQATWYCTGDPRGRPGPRSGPRGRPGSQIVSHNLSLQQKIHML